MADYIEIPNINNKYQLTTDPFQKLELVEGEITIILPEAVLNLSKIIVIFTGIDGVNITWPYCKWENNLPNISSKYVYEITFQYVDKTWKAKYKTHRYIVSYNNMDYLIDKLIDILDRRYAEMVIEHQINEISDIPEDVLNNLIVASKTQKDEWDALIGHKHNMTDIEVNDERFPGINNMDELFNMLFQYASDYKNNIVKAVTGIMPYNKDKFNNMNIQEIIEYIDKLPYNHLTIDIINIEYTKYGYMRIEFNTYDGIITEFGIEDIYGYINYMRGNILNLEPNKNINIYGRTSSGSVIKKMINTGPDLYGKEGM